MSTCIIPTFFCPVQTLCNLVSRTSSLFGINAEKYEKYQHEFRPYAFIQDLRWHKGWGSCFNYLENRHRNIIQKKYGRNLILWTIIFLFLHTFYTVDDS